MKPDTELLRQIDPQYVSADGTISSVAFRPMPKDGDCLSAYDGDAIGGAEAAWRHFTERVRGRSAGVLAVEVAECDGMGLPAVSTPLSEPPDFDEHVCIDFAGLSKGQRRNKSQELRDLAMERGWRYKVQR